MVQALAASAAAASTERFCRSRARLREAAVRRAAAPSPRTSSRRRDGGGSGLAPTAGGLETEQGAGRRGACAGWMRSTGRRAGRRERRCGDGASAMVAIRVAPTWSSSSWSPRLERAPATRRKAFSCMQVCHLLHGPQSRAGMARPCSPLPAAALVASAPLVRACLAWRFTPLPARAALTAAVLTCHVMSQGLQDSGLQVTWAAGAVSLLMLACAERVWQLCRVARAVVRSLPRIAVPQSSWMP